MSGPPERDFHLSPVHDMLGFRLLERSAEHAVLSMEPRADFLQEEGVLQGGILTALADAAAVYVTLPDLGPTRSMTSIEFKVNFLRPGLLERGTIEARAELVKRGRSVVLVRSRVLQAGAEIALGLFTYLVFEREQAR